MGAQWKHAGRVEAGNKKGALFTKLAKEIIVAAKNGDPNPENNARLRAAVEAARRQSMTRDTIERSIKRGAGLLEPVHYDTVVYEGFAPNNVPVIVECLTDNKNRTASDLRVLFRKGQLGAPGSVQWMFDRKGVVEATHPANMDIYEAAVEANAGDVALEEMDEEGGAPGAVFTCDPADLGAMTSALAALGWVASSSEIRWLPKTPVDLQGAAKDDTVAFLQAIDDNDDVHRMYAGLA
jgi:YebC/PmpR family DNA-binding regulatory protein